MGQSQRHASPATPPERLRVDGESQEGRSSTLTSDAQNSSQCRRDKVEFVHAEEENRRSSIGRALDLFDGPSSHGSKRSIQRRAATSCAPGKSRCGTRAWAFVQSPCVLEITSGCTTGCTPSTTRQRVKGFSSASPSISRLQKPIRLVNAATGQPARFPIRQCVQ